MIVVVMGVAGSGKTTVGRLLAGELGWKFYDADDFHPPANVERMRAGVPLSDADRVPWLAALRDLLAERAAADAPTVLACSALKRRYRDALVPTGAPPGWVRFVHLDVTREVAARRLAERRGHFMPPALVDSQFATLEAPHDALRADATRPVDEIVEDVLRGL